MTTAMALASASGDINFPEFWLAFMLGIIAGMVVMAWMRKLSQACVTSRCATSGVPSGYEVPVPCRASGGGGLAPVGGMQR